MKCHQADVCILLPYSLSDGCPILFDGQKSTGTDNFNHCIFHYGNCLTRANLNQASNHLAFLQPTTYIPTTVNDDGKIQAIRRIELLIHTTVNSSYRRHLGRCLVEPQQLGYHRF